MSESQPAVGNNDPAVDKKITDQTIFDNYATPLVGQFLNLPREPVDITCPACQIHAKSEVTHDLKWYTSTINGFYSCLFVMFCCCFCRTFSHPCKHTDMNHYCKNCGCYFGRVMKPKKYLKKTKAK